MTTIENIPTVNDQVFRPAPSAPFEKCFIQEASTLGWKPGVWPAAIRFRGEVLSRESLTEEFGACYANRGRSIVVQVLND